MSLPQSKVLLGAVLQQAGLVSGDRVQQALQEQRKNSTKLRLGEILAARGHINQQTADFFVEDWSRIIRSGAKQPIGQYLKQAALLNEWQIQTILAEQKQSKLKFGELAIAKGWLKQNTLDFFLKYLAPHRINPLEQAPRKSSTVEYDREIHEGFYKIKLKLLNLDDREAYSEAVLKKVLSWTGGQSFLTRKLLDLIGENHNSVISGRESKQIDYLVQYKLLTPGRDREIDDYLQTIENRLLYNQQIKPEKLLKLYQKILITPVSADRSQEQQALVKTGLVVKQQEQLTVANRIYQLVFDSVWVHEQLKNLSYHSSSAIATIPQAEAANLAKPVKTSPIQTEDNRPFRYKNLLLLLALIALLLVFLNNISRRIKVKTAFKKGNEYLKQQSFEEAIAQYNTLLNIDSNYFQAWTNRGYALAGLGQYNEMRESCSTATIIDPGAVYAWNCQGEALHNLKRSEEAIAAFDKAINLDRSDPIFLINKSESLKAVGKHEESLVTIEQAIEVLQQIEAIKGKAAVSGEFAVALTFLGNGYRRREQYESAILNYDRALEYSPQYFPAQIGKGIVLNRVKRYQEAKSEFEKILTDKQLSRAKKAQTWFYIGKTLCNAQQSSASLAAFERALELRPNYPAAQQAKQQCR